MKKLSIAAIIIIAIAGILTISCETTSVQEIQPVVENPTYNANIKPIFSAKCISCHSSNGENPALTNYAEVLDAVENGSVLCKIQNECGSVMPPSGKLPQVLIDMVNNWKDQGYVEQ